MRSQLSVEGFAYNKAQDSDVKGTWVPAAADVPAHAMFKNVDQIFRYEMIKDGKTIQLSGKLHCDLFQQDKPLLPGVPLSIKFTRSRIPLAFTALTANKLPKVALRKPKLFVREVRSNAFLPELAVQEPLKLSRDIPLREGSDETNDSKLQPAVCGMV